MNGAPLLGADEPAPVSVHRPDGRSPFLLVCDHAGRRVPRRSGRLGLAEAEFERHIAWDIGAAAVSRQIADGLDAALISQAYSRLVIDCNRPPEVASSIPELSEATAVPGNVGLDEAEREARLREVFRPYHGRIAAEIDRRAREGQPTILIAMHSFTPVYHGVSRPWHIGTLYGRDERLAAALRRELARDGRLTVGDNEPYAVSDTTDYTIPVHGERRGVPHVGIEIRQDLIASSTGQTEWAEILMGALPAAAAAALGEDWAHGPAGRRIGEPSETLRHFERQPEGSWLCVAPVAIETTAGILAASPGMVFAFGDRHEGLDVAEYLEQLGAQFGS